MTDRLLFSHAHWTALGFILAAGLAGGSIANASEWSRMLGTDDQTIASVAMRTLADEMIVAGHVSDLRVPERIAWLARLGPDGAFLGATRLADDAASMNVHPLDDGGAIVAVGIERDAPGTQDLLAVRLSPDGNIAWQVDVDAASSLFFVGAVELADGSLLLLGDERATPSALGDAWLARIDAGGDVTWQRRLGGAGADVLRQGVELPGGRVVLLGDTDSFGPDGKDAWLVELDPDTPALRSQRRFVAPGSDLGTNLHLRASGNLVFSAWTDSWGDADVLVIELDPSLEPRWQRLHGGAGDEFGGLLVRRGEQLYLAGTSSSYTPMRETTDAWLLALDPDGLPGRQRTYGGPEHDVATWTTLPDGNFLLVGQATVLPDPRDPTARPRIESWLSVIEPDGWIEWQGVDATAEVVTTAPGVFGDVLTLSVMPRPLDFLGADADARILRVEDLTRRPPCFQPTVRPAGGATAFHLDVDLPRENTTAALDDATAVVSHPAPPPSFPLEVLPGCGGPVASRIDLSRSWSEEFPDGVFEAGEKIFFTLGVRSLDGIVPGLYIEERFREAFMLPWATTGGAVHSRGALTWGPFTVSPDSPASVSWQARVDCQGQVDEGLIEAAFATAAAGASIDTDAWLADASPARLTADATQSVTDSNGDGRLGVGDLVRAELVVDLQRRGARELVVEHRLDPDLEWSAASFTIPPSADDGNGRLTWMLRDVGDGASSDWSVEVAAPVASATHRHADGLVETTFRTTWPAMSDCEEPYFVAIAIAKDVALVSNAILLRHGDTSCLATALGDRLAFPDGGPGLRENVPGTTAVDAIPPLRVAGDGLFGGARCDAVGGGALVHYQLSTDALLLARRDGDDVVLDFETDESARCAGPWHLVPIEDPDAEDFDYNVGLGRAIAMSGRTLVAGSYQDGPQYGHPGAAYVLDRVGDEWVQRARLMASDTGDFWYFGVSAAIDGDTIVVGAMRADVGPLVEAGAVYVFERRGDDWIERQKLPLPRPPLSGDTLYAQSLALSADRLAVGWPGAVDPGGVQVGSVVIYERRAGIWELDAELFAPAPESWSDFGRAVALRGDTLVVGAPGRSGAAAAKAHVFVRDASGWAHVQALSTAGPAVRFGTDVALDGATIAVGATDPGVLSGGSGIGAVHLFERTGSTWSETDVVRAPEIDDYFGSALALEGERLLVGAMLGHGGAGAAYVFEREGGAWVEREPLEQPYPDSNDRYGEDVLLHDGLAIVTAEEAHSTTLSRHALLHAFACPP